MQKGNCTCAIRVMDYGHGAEHVQSTEICG